MPIEIKLTLGSDTFEAKGDFAFESTGLSAALRQWLNAKSEIPGQLEQVADTLERQTEQLAATVAQSTLPTT